jgi:hypothetical protein
MTLYEVISELRRENPTPSASRTLDIVTAELGRTRENLRRAVANLQDQPLPTNGKEILQRLLERAEREGVDDLDAGMAPGERVLEPLDPGTVGVGLLMGGASLIAVGLLVAVFVVQLNKIFHWFS